MWRSHVFGCAAPPASVVLEHHTLPCGAFTQPSLSSPPGRLALEHHLHELYFVPDLPELADVNAVLHHYTQADR